MNIYTLPMDNEEALAVVTARTSRSAKNFKEIQAEVEERGHKEFIEKNVLGYGHDSVAEMAMCPAVAVENVSDLAACVLCSADPQLRVQMTSTRYQKMDARNVTHSGLVGVAERMMARYKDCTERVTSVVNETMYPGKVTLIRDISRAWLPAGIGSQLAVRGDARTMRDTINYLLGHPMAEVNEIGKGILAAVKEHIELLFDRHVTAAPSLPEPTFSGPDLRPGGAGWNRADLKMLDDYQETLAELKLWRDSEYRRRHRIAYAPHGPFMRAYICSDWGAYRDLTRNRTIHQDDMMPRPHTNPDNPLWAFEEYCPDVCAELRELRYDEVEHKDPYLASMGSILNWRAGGHALNWAYAMRARSGVPGCHPAYALPMRKLMSQIFIQAPKAAEAMGIVEDENALLGIEFHDRVTSVATGS